MREGNTDFLASEYREILDGCQQLETEFKRQPCHLERIYGKFERALPILMKRKDVTLKAFVSNMKLECVLSQNEGLKNVMNSTLLPLCNELLAHPSENLSRERRK